MKNLILTALVALLALPAWAVPARPGTTITHRQTDGSVVTLQLCGDEFLHYYVNPADGQVMEPTTGGDYVTIAPVTLEARQNRAGQQRSQVNAARVQRLPLMHSAGGPQRVGSVNTLSGTKKALVLLVNFSDVKFSFTNSDFRNRYTSDSYTSNGHIASVKGYFHAQSYGNFDLDIDVVGPVTLSNTMAYYGANNYYGEDVRPQQMVSEAVELANSQVNYADYDWDGDGNVELVFVVYAGYAEAQGGSSQTIWPHASAIDSKRLDGVYISSYACTSELSGDSGKVMDGIGTFCHEFSHCLGFPDLYDVDYNTNGLGVGMGSYDLMSNGSYNGPQGRGEVPCGYSAYERWMAGWLTPTVLSSPTEITGLAPVADQPQACIVYNPSNSNEYLIIENRQSKDFFKYCGDYTMSSGLLISHINYNASLWANNAINNIASNQYYTFIPADKSYSENSAADFQGDYFRPGNELTSTSHTGVYGAWRNGAATFTGMDITDITMSGGNAGFRFGGSASPGVDPTPGNAIVTIDEHGIITDVTGVEPKIYQRAGTGTTFYINNNKLAGAYQSGKVEVVEDGNYVWIKEPLSRFNTGAWVQGTKSGNTITIPTRQPLAYDSEWDATVSLRWGSIADDFEAADSYSDVITFTIDGNSLILEGTASPAVSSEGYVIGAYWDDDDSYQGYWDAETVLTYDAGYVPPSTDLVELPAGATVQDWYLNGVEYTDNTNTADIANQDVKVAFVGSDVYVQGIFEKFPESWIKGTIAGSTITFSKLQYIGDFASFNIWMVGVNSNSELSDAEATYNSETRTITFTTDILANADDLEIYYLTYLSNVVLSAEASTGGVDPTPGNAIVTTDAHGIIKDVTGVEPKIYQRAGTGTTFFISNKQLTYTYQSGTVEVVEDGDNVWIKDPLTRAALGSWVKGTKSGNTITIPTRQPLGYDSTYDATVSLRWGSGKDLKAADSYSDVITFTIDGNSLILEGTTSLLTSREGYVIGLYWDDDNSYQGYWDAETVLNYDAGYVPPSTDLVELPAGATVQSWYLNGAGYNDNTSIANQDVKVAFVGSDVYVQGIFEYFPESWIKGTIAGSTVTFSNLQYLGDYYSNNIWMTGYDASTGDLCDAVATYDKAAKTITFSGCIFANADAFTLYYLQGIEDAVLSAEAKVIEEPVLTTQTSTLPYANTFDTNDELGELAVYDANGDGKTFEVTTDNGSQAIVYTYSTSKDADEYLVFPGLPLEAGVTYSISIDARAHSSSYPERLEVLCGKEAKVSAFTIQAIPRTDIANAQYQTLVNNEFTVNESGMYYFAIHAISDADRWNLYIDNFIVIERLNNDLAVTDFTVPSMVQAGDDINVTVGIENLGLKAVEAGVCSVDFYVDGEKAGSVAGTALAPKAKTSVAFTVPTSVMSPATMDIYAEIVFAKDLDSSNNTTAVNTVRITLPEYPIATDLEAVARRSGVDLAWGEPDFESPVTESFESYCPFCVDEAGDWTFVDGDGYGTYGFTGISFENSGSPMAGIVFDQSIADGDLDGFACTGNQAFAFFASDGGQNDDWMISPMLPGCAQTVKFMARSWTVDYGEEEFEFLYSTTDTDIASFIKLDEFDDVPDEYTEYSFDLPEGAKYFAIHCVSNDRFIFIVDDVTYIRAAMEIEGYNIYRNGAKVNDQPVADTAYTDADGAVGDEYTVTVVYTQGESAPCTPVIAEALQFTPGDVNHDGKFSAADVSMVVAYVLGGDPVGGFIEAADVSGDGVISAVDVSLVVSYILEDRQINAPQRAKAIVADAAMAERSDISVNADGNLELTVTGISAYSAAQFCIALPEGVAVKSVSLLGSDGTGHSVAFSQADGTARVLAFSPLNHNFSAAATFAIELEGSVCGNDGIAVDGIRLVEVAGRDITEAAATGCAADIDLSGLIAGLTRGIDIKANAEGVVITAPEECDITISDTLGRTFRHHLHPGANRLPLTTGVYFINNKKVIIK